MKKATAIDIIVIIFSLILLFTYQSKELTVELKAPKIVELGKKIDITVTIKGNYKYYKILHNGNQLVGYDNNNFEQRWDLLGKNLIYTKECYSLVTDRLNNTGYTEKIRLEVIGLDNKSIIKEIEISVINPFNIARQDENLAFFLDLINYIS